MSDYGKKLADHAVRQDENVDGAIDDIARAVMGKRLSESLSDLELARSAIGELFKAFRIKFSENDELPPGVSTPEEELDYYLRPHGIMRRTVKLTEGWYRDATGPMLGTLKSDGSVVLLRPEGFTGYSFRDFRTGKRVRVNRKTQQLLDEEALCFYRPLPLRALTTPDLVKFMFGQLTAGEWFVYVVMIAVPILLGMISPVFSQLLFGRVLNSGEPNALIAIAVFMISFAVSNLLLSVFQNLIKSRMSIKIDVAVQSAVMGRILDLPATFFRRYPSGDLNKRCSYMLSLCRMIFNTVMTTGLTSLFSLVYVGQIFTFAPALAVPALIVVFGSLAVSVITAFVQISVNKKKLKLSAQTSGMTYEIITGVQKLKLTGSEKAMFSRWGRQYAKEAALEYNPYAFLRLNKTIQLGISIFGMLAIYTAAISSKVALADYYAFSTAYGMVSGAFASLAGIIAAVAGIRPSLEMVRPILETAPEISVGKAEVTYLKGEIELNHITFRYQENMPDVLRDFSLKVRPGEYLAIAGTTGCGKSTLMRLLLGFETTQKGAVYYDRREVSGLDLKSLRRHIGVVMQDGKLFNDSIFANITISAPQATLDDAWDAAEKAAIADEIRAMPMGMHTMISEGQGGISGGQRQRLMIARAIAAKPSILMFDEATSALDNITQEKVTKSIEELGCTRIAIAHRLSTVRNADRIIAMDEGRIVEDGTYDELIAKNGFFADLVRRQQIEESK